MLSDGFKMEGKDLQELRENVLKKEVEEFEKVA